jgi:hypothetical protein
MVAAVATWLQRRFQLRSVVLVTSFAARRGMKRSLPRPRRRVYALGRSIVPWFCMESAYAISFGILVPGGETGSYRLCCEKDART